MILLKFWREILLTIALAAIWQLYAQNEILKDKVKFTSDVAKECQEEKTELQKKLSVINSAINDASAAQKQAEAKRLKVINDLSVKIDAMRKQPIPVECEKVIEWAITNKGDLSWIMKKEH